MDEVLRKSVAEVAIGNMPRYSYYQLMNVPVEAHVDVNKYQVTNTLPILDLNNYINFPHMSQACSDFFH